ncbi:AI-2E family transporter [Merismopedia glauca]|uniref:AI-2E family transporter n=1 Tax=Merismopedia glauca TaxID=292586 RepID=UPI001FE9CDEF|nr:AI-2E family transporter [Merismopedia glauca]
MLIFFSAWAFILVLEYFQNVIFIFTFAATIAFLLNYPVTWLQKFLPRNISVVFVFVIGIAILVALTITILVTLTSQGQQALNSLTNAVNSVSPVIDDIEKFLAQKNINIDLDLIRQKANNEVLSRIGQGIDYSLGSVTIFLSNFLNFIFIAVVSFFMLLEGERLWGFILKMLPTEFQDRFDYLVKRNFLGFFRSQIILCLFLTTAYFIVFLILKVPFALLLALIAGFLDLIPGIGATLGVATTFFIVLTQNVGLAVQVVVACIILQQIQDNLIAPRIMRGSLNINPVVVFFALLIGARVAGLLGVFMSIPLAGLIVSWFEIEEMTAGLPEATPTDPEPTSEVI